MAKFNRARIVSVGSFVPENVMDNREFEKFLDTSDEWIVTGLESARGILLLLNRRLQLRTGC